MDAVPPWFVDIATPVPNGQISNCDAFAKNRKCDKECIQDLLTDEESSTG